MKEKVLFLDTVHEVLHERLSEAGYSCEFDYTCSHQDLAEKIQQYSGLVLRSRITLSEDLLSRGENLKWIARSGSGLENIDLAAAEHHGIEVINSPEGNRDAVGEHAIGMLLMLLHRLRLADIEVRRGEWKREDNRGRELKEMTVGIIGFGVMGSGFAEKLQGFGCRIIAHDKYKKGFGNSNVEEVGLDRIMAEGQIVSIHLPMTEETKFYVNQEFLSKFENPIYLINTARGKHVKTIDLVHAIKSGQVLGACLDVLEFETASLEKLILPSDSKALDYLKSSDKVILTPHIAGWTEESYFKLSNVLADKILAL